MARPPTRDAAPTRAPASLPDDQVCARGVQMEASGNMGFADVVAAAQKQQKQQSRERTPKDGNTPNATPQGALQKARSRKSLERAARWGVPTEAR